MAANLGWLYWVDYFKGIDYTQMDSPTNENLVKEKVGGLILAANDQELANNEEAMLGNAHFLATTRYPGLVVGIGYAHELPDIKNQPTLGFYFDYTTGLPVVPGSSVKGVLRSAFEHRVYLKALIEALTNKEWSEEEIGDLEVEIFGNRVGANEVQGGSDIFFDAVPVKKIGALLSDDYITPHGDGITDEPNPLYFIKVAGGVTFRFDFDLTESVVGEKIVTPGQKRELFIKILQDLGLGAKSNVGYGYFENFRNYQTQEEREAERRQEILRRCREAETSNDRALLERFLVDFPQSDCRERIEAALTRFDNIEKSRHIQEAFERMDKNNSRHIEAFIKKYAEDPLAEEWVTKAQELLQGPSEETEHSFDAILEKSRLKEIEAFVKSFIKQRALNEKEKAMLEKAISNATDLPKKRKKFPFGTFGGDKCLGKDRANELADKLGL